MVLDRRLKNAVNMGKHSPRNTHLLDTRESTLERDLMCAASVGNSSPVVKNPSAKAGDTGSVPEFFQRKILLSRK